MAVGTSLSLLSPSPSLGSNLDLRGALLPTEVEAPCPTFDRTIFSCSRRTDMFAILDAKLWGWWSDKPNGPPATPFVFRDLNAGMMADDSFAQTSKLPTGYLQRNLPGIGNTMVYIKTVLLPCLSS